MGKKSKSLREDLKLRKANSKNSRALKKVLVKVPVEENVRVEDVEYDIKIIKL